MVDNVPFVGSRLADNSVVASAVDLLAVVSADDDRVHDSASGFSRGVAHHVPHLIVWATGVVLGPAEVVLTLSEEDVGALVVVIFPFLLHRDNILESLLLEAKHIVVELAYGEEAVAPVEVVLARLRVLEDVGVNDMVFHRAFGRHRYHRFAECVLEGAGGVGGGSNADVAVGDEVVEVLVGNVLAGAVLTFDDAGGPKFLVGPGDVGAEVEDRAFLLPFLHVLAGEDVGVVILPALAAVGSRVEVVLARLLAIHYLGVGVETLYDRVSLVARDLRLLRGGASHHQCRRHGSNKS